jgi:stage II sporulation protein P
MIPQLQRLLFRSLEAIESYLQEYPSIKIVIDLHRDALVDTDGTTYKTVAQIDGQTCSQVMLVMGSNDSGLQHDSWQENLKLALRLQYSMNELYPTLARPTASPGTATISTPRQGPFFSKWAATAILCRKRWPPSASSPTRREA